MLTPRDFRSVACPTYPEIRLSLLPGRGVGDALRAFAPQCLHIATEGPLGHAARRYCLRHGMRFTTSYHTQFPQYLRARFPIPIRASYRALRWFHGAAVRCMVSTPSLRQELLSRGFKNLATWRRGVDTEVFKPRPKDFLDLPRPIAAYVGRVAIEKNIEAFLQMPWSGSKIVIGDGPERARLEAQHPGVVFAGYRFEEDLARHLAAADVMVFPSRTDTFGLVNLEAMACGVPVAAYPVTGPDRCDRGRRHRGVGYGPRTRGRARPRARSEGLPRARAQVRMGREHAGVRGQSGAVPLEQARKSRARRRPPVHTARRAGLIRS